VRAISDWRVKRQALCLPKRQKDIGNEFVYDVLNVEDDFTFAGIIPQWGLERAAGIEPALKAWKAFVIPFHHARDVRII
jgi:hypothetical protein